MKNTLFLSALLGFNFTVAAQTAKHEWTRNFGTNLNTIGTSLATDNLDNVYTAGTFDGIADFDPSNLSTDLLTSKGLEDIFLSKMNAKGEHLWVKQIAGTGIDQVHHLKLDPSGNIYLVGSFQGTIDMDPGPGTSNLISNGSNDVFLAKYDVNGSLLWAKSFGSSDDDQGIGLDVSASSVAITGYFRGNIDFDASNPLAQHSASAQSDIFVAHFDLLGNYNWSHSIGGPSDEEGKSVRIDKSGNVLIAGFFNNSVDFNPGVGTSFKAASGGRDAFLVKFSPSGMFSWVKTFGGNGLECVQTVLTDESNNIISVGYYTSITDFDPMPAVDFYLNPGSLSSIFIQKLDSNGNFLWAKGFNGYIQSYSQSAALDHLGNIYLTGYFNSSVDFGTGSGISNLSTTGFEDIFIVKLYPSGKYASAHKTGGTKYESGYSLFMDKKGAMFACGKFSGTVDFDPGSNVANTAAFGSSISDAYVVKWTNFPASITDKAIDNKLEVQVYPNPSTGLVRVELGTMNKQNYSLHVRNTLGQLVYRADQLEQNNSLDLSTLPNGLFILTIFADGQMHHSTTLHKQ